MTATIARLKVAIRRWYDDETGTKLDQSGVGNEYLNEFINDAITHAAPYVALPSSTSVSIASSTLTYIITGNMDWPMEVWLNSSITGYPPTQMEPWTYKFTRSEAGVLTINFLQQYTAAQTATIRGFTSFARLTTDEAATYLDQDYIKHYAMARIYESLMNRGGALSTETPEQNLMMWHQQEADKILFAQSNNPNLKVEKKQK